MNAGEYDPKLNDPRFIKTYDPRLDEPVVDGRSIHTSIASAIKMPTITPSNKMPLQHVEIEHFVGEGRQRDRHIFERAETVEYVNGSHVFISSKTEGQLYVKLENLTWMRAQPATNLISGSDMDKELLAIIQGGNVINAIKRRREITGESLKEAKEYVDLLRAKYGL